MKKLLTILPLALLLLALPACHSKKKAVRSRATTTTSATASAQKQTVAYRVMQAQPSYDGINISKMSTEIKFNGRRFNVTISVRLLSGERLQVAVMPLFGIEMFRLEADQKKVCLVDKLNRRYYEATYEELSKAAGVDLSFNEVECLLCARLFAAGKPAYFSGKQTWKESSAGGAHTISFTTSGLDHTFGISADCRITSATLKKGGSMSAQMGYGKYQTSGRTTLPMHYTLNITIPKYTADCTFDIKKFTLGRPTFDAPNTAGLQRVSLTDIINK